MNAARFSLSIPGRAPRRPRESIVPMINIVFLLLIFFMLTATIAPPDPFDLVLPETEADSGAATPPQMLVLAVGLDGALAHGGAEGDAALAALGAAFRPGDVVALRADAGLDGAVFARLLADLAALGMTEVRLAVRQGAGAP
jgi:biopolymer transport protein ExbD